MVNIYCGLLTLITLGNVIVTTALFVPIMRRLNTVLSGFEIKMTKRKNDHSQNNFETTSKDIEPNNSRTDDNKTNDADKMNKLEENVFSEQKRNDEVRKSEKLNTDDDKVEKEEMSNIIYVKMKNKNQTSGHRFIKKRITVMLFVIVLVYVLSYIPSLAILILSYTIEDFSFINVSKLDAATWTFLARFVFF